MKIPNEVMQQTFDDWNRDKFDNKLPQYNIVVGGLKAYHGNINVKKKTIKINPTFTMDQMFNTLLHETTKAQLVHWLLNNHYTVYTEAEFKEMFSECETGAMPPFGNLYGLDVYATESLSKDEEIAFNAGTHDELVKMSYKDFEMLVKPKVLKFSTRD